MASIFFPGDYSIRKHQMSLSKMQSPLTMKWYIDLFLNILFSKQTNTLLIVRGKRGMRKNGKIENEIN